MNAGLYNLLWRSKNLLTGSRLADRLRLMATHEALPRQELSAFQWRRFRELLQHACTTTAFYRGWLKEAGACLEDITNWDDYNRLPVVNKEHLRQHAEEFISSDCDRSTLRAIHSGGSTGIPTTVYHTPLLGEWSEDQEHVMYSWLALPWGTKRADIWGLNRSNLRYELDDAGWWHRFFKNRILLDAFRLETPRLERMAQLLLTFKPGLINGYVSALACFADFLLQRRISLSGVRAVVSSAEVLLPGQRAMIQEAFSAPVFDLYGSTEINWIALECGSHAGLHVFEASRIVTLDRTRTEGGVGPILVTDLENRAFPLIRYDLGDLALLESEPCECGRRYIRIRELLGRTSDLFTLPDGRTIHGEYFTHVFYEWQDAVRQFQVHQLRPEKIAVRVVPGEGLSNIAQRQDFERSIVAAFQKRTDDAVQFSFEYVGSIPAEASGKFRFTKSDVYRGQPT